MALNEGHGLDALYLDYRKAFDTVPHCRLIKKLEAYGIQGKVSRWLEDFLNNSVVLINTKSEWGPTGISHWPVTLHPICQ